MDAFANILIRPKRAEYKINDLGPNIFHLNNQKKKRIDFEVINDNGMILQCSIFTPQNINNIQYPCVLYCHGNTGSRLDALELVELFLPDDIIIACFDFSGSGLSEGRYVTFGYNEKNDIRCVIRALRDMPFVSRIAIWGRSLGASASIMYAVNDNQLSGLVLDTPFSNLAELCYHQLKNSPIYVFGFLLSNIILGSIRNTINKKANFNIGEISPINEIHKINAPIYFLHGKKDKIIPISHSKKLYEAAKCEKEFIELNTDHYDDRSSEIIIKIKQFLKNKFSDDYQHSNKSSLLPNSSGYSHNLNNNEFSSYIITSQFPIETKTHFPAYQVSFGPKNSGYFVSFQSHKDTFLDLGLNQIPKFFEKPDEPFNRFEDEGNIGQRQGDDDEDIYDSYKRREDQNNINFNQGIHLISNQYKNDLFGDYSMPSGLNEDSELTNLQDKLQSSENSPAIELNYVYYSAEKQLTNRRLSLRHNRIAETPELQQQRNSLQNHTGTFDDHQNNSFSN